MCRTIESVHLFIDHVEHVLGHIRVAILISQEQRLRYFNHDSITWKFICDNFMFIYQYRFAMVSR